MRRRAASLVILHRSAPLALLALVAAAPPPLFVVTAAGIRIQDTSGDETAALCRSFRLSGSDARRFFATAEQVSERAYVHDLEMSQCRTLGTIRSAGPLDGARWSIDKERRGLIRQRSGKTAYVYCRRCTNPLFEAVYDPDAE